MEKKWYIFDGEDTMCWSNQILEFDTKEAAENFLGSILLKYQGDIKVFDSCEIKESIIFHDGGYLNATGYLIEYDSINDEPYLFKDEVWI